MNLVVAAFAPTRFLVQSLMPRKVRDVGYAVQEFPRYTEEMIRKEREGSYPAKAGENFLRAMIRVSDQEREFDLKGGAKKFLNDSEIQGNAFLLTLAGYDTTANTLSYAVMRLASEPGLQDWLREEITQVAQEHDAQDDDSYEKVFPKLVRCLALMFETLRHYTPIGHIIRCIKVSQEITTNQRTYRFPANSKVYVSAQAVHIDPVIWGNDFAAFRPQRWLEDSAQRPALKKMPPGAFIAWSVGPRNCPGMKMAQVEFTRVIYEILRQCRVEPAFEPNETLESAQERLRWEMKDSQPRISLQINHPERVKLRWVPI